MKAEAILWEAGGVDAKGRPYLYAGLKGIVALELRVRTAAFDLHSSYGAVVENPIYRLSRALASLRDEEGRVLIPGFYAKVRPLTPLEMEVLAQIPDESEALREAFGVRDFLGGARNLDFNQRLYAEPCVNFNGFHAGYGGPGSKTVLPAEARAKLDFRLVPDQDPEEVADQAEAYLKAVCPPGYALEVRRLHGGRPVLTDPFSPPMRLMARALEEVWGRPPVYTREGGTIPVVAELKETLGAPIVLLGLGLPDDNLHAPNEKLDLVNLEKGVEVIRRFHRLLAG